MRSVPTALQSPFVVAVLLIAGAAAAQTSRDITIHSGRKSYDPQLDLVSVRDCSRFGIEGVEGDGPNVPG